jgi:hypothetical protein
MFTINKNQTNGLISIFFSLHNLFSFISFQKVENEIFYFITSLQMKVTDYYARLIIRLICNMTPVLISKCAGVGKPLKKTLEKITLGQAGLRFEPSIS